MNERKNREKELREKGTRKGGKEGVRVLILATHEPSESHHSLGPGHNGSQLIRQDSISSLPRQFEALFES